MCFLVILKHVMRLFVLYMTLHKWARQYPSVPRIDEIIYQCFLFWYCWRLTIIMAHEHLPTISEDVLRLLMHLEHSDHWVM